MVLGCSWDAWLARPEFSDATMRRQLRRLALGVLLSVATAAARKAGAEGTCDADAKGVVAAGKKLGDELKEMHQVEGLGSIADVSRTWRLVRNQQDQVEEAFAAVNARFSAAIRKLSGVKTIKADDKAQVEELFFGGQPFFVQCAAPVDKLHAIFMETSADMAAAGVTPAVIDCNGKLPSGRTVTERFFKDKSLEDPVFFVVANRMAPRPFNVKPHVTPEMLVSFASNITAVKVARLADNDDLREHCLKRKQCALVIHDGNYTEGEAAAAKAVARKHRGIAVAEIDSRKLRLSIEDALPPNKGEPRMVFLSVDNTAREERKVKDGKKKESVYQGKAFKGKAWDDSALSDFLEAVAKPGAKLTRIKTTPKVVDRKEEEQAMRKAERRRKEAADRKAKKKDSPYDHVDKDPPAYSSAKKGTGAAGSKKGGTPKPGGFRESTATKTRAGSKGGEGGRGGSTAGRGKVQVDGAGRQRKSWSKEEQARAEQVLLVWGLVWVRFMNAEGRGVDAWRTCVLVV